MGTYSTSVAAATAIVGYDINTDKFWASLPQNRVIRGIALKGSAAAGDTEIDFYVDAVFIANLFNNNTGFPNIDDVMPLENLLIPGGGHLRAVVVNAPATNPINALYLLEDV